MADKPQLKQSINTQSKQDNKGVWYCKSETLVETNKQDREHLQTTSKQLIK